MKRLLLIIDPQIDFINGTLPVPEAIPKMERLAAYIKRTDGEYAAKAITLDWHPYNHCSFRENGGEWPMHCVQNTTGAAICPALVEPLYTTHGEVTVLRKGVRQDSEEYSIFRNEASSVHLDNLINGLHIDRIDLCGIAGDVCVLDTLKDGIKRYGTSMFHVLQELCPSLDGGKALDMTIKKLLP